jgi:hypothetical protein
MIARWRFEASFIGLFLVERFARGGAITRPRSGGILRLRGGVKPGHFWG